MMPPRGYLRANYMREIRYARTRAKQNRKGFTQTAPLKNQMAAMQNAQVGQNAHSSYSSSLFRGLFG